MASVFDAYLAGEASAFFAEHYADPVHRRRAVDRARPVTPALLAVLREQNSGRGAAVDANLTSLAAGAAVVVTGQQMGLFLGPLFTLYKAATAIVAAKKLATETRRAVVPLFWLQTEDHDMPEIARTYLRGPGGEPIALEVPVDAQDRRSVAHQALPQEVSRELEKLSDALAGLPDGPAHAERLRRHYRPGAPWSAAFRGALGELLAQDGLLFLDPRDARVAELALPIHRRAIDEAGPIADVLLERSRALEQKGFEVPVHVRAESPLCFFHPRGADGPRFRLAKNTGGFSEIGGAATHDLNDDQDPLCFSTSALLRPLIQDALLPTAAYVGGPGEIAYFAQLQPLYTAFGMSMPIVLPRARLTIVEDKTDALLTRLGLDVADVKRPEDELLRGSSGGASLALPDLVAALEPLRSELAALGLTSALEKTQAAVEHATKKLSEKIDHARLHQNERRVTDVRRLKQLLFPLDQPQERVLGPAYFAARYGESRFVQAIIGAIDDPFDARPRELRP